MKTETWNYELTDTFGGEANYSWVRRGSVEVAERHPCETFALHERRIVRAVKKAIGYNGQRCKRADFGETIALYPVSECTVIFIS